MAVLSPTLNTALMLRSGSADCVILLSLRNVNTGDTLDVGTSGSNLFGPALSLLKKCTGNEAGIIASLAPEGS